MLGIHVAIGIFVFWCDVTNHGTMCSVGQRPEWTHASPLWHTIRRGRPKNKPRIKKSKFFSRCALTVANTIGTGGPIRKKPLVALTNKSGERGIARLLGLLHQDAGTLAMPPPEKSPGGLNLISIVAGRVGSGAGLRGGDRGPPPPYAADANRPFAMRVPVRNGSLTVSAGS